MKVDNYTHLTQSPYFKVAHSIGIRLCRDAIWHGNRCNWLGNNVEVFDNKYQSVTQTFGSNFYTGLSGIAYFLSKLFMATQDGVILHTLNGTLNNVVQMMDEEELGNFGIYSGKIGVAIKLIEIGEELNRPYLIEKGFSVLKTLSQKEIQEFEIDVIAGAAGVIPSVLSIYKKHQNHSHLLQLAIKCGNFLLTKADKGDKGWSWITVGNTMGLTGYSHGVAGIGLAFLELFDTTGDERFYEAAFSSFAYESSWFSAKEGNWPDLRTNDGNQGKPLEFIIAWCHGAPGIALSRMKAYELTDNESFKQEAYIALETTYKKLHDELQNPQSRSNYSLCHGIAGNADILLRGYQMFGEPKYKAIAEKVGNLGAERFEQTGLDWPSGVSDPTGGSTGQEFAPGMMLGTSGTGYFYLRLADPQNIKTVLLLESENTSHKNQMVLDQSIEQAPLILNDI
jgi:lantibiotic modifying enzyme